MVQLINSSGIWVVSSSWLLQMVLLGTYFTFTFLSIYPGVKSMVHDSIMHVFTFRISCQTAIKSGYCSLSPHQQYIMNLWTNPNPAQTSRYFLYRHAMSLGDIHILKSEIQRHCHRKGLEHKSAGTGLTQYLYTEPNTMTLLHLAEKAKVSAAQKMTKNAKMHINTSR